MDVSKCGSRYQVLAADCGSFAVNFRIMVVVVEMTLALYPDVVMFLVVSASS